MFMLFFGIEENRNFA